MPVISVIVPVFNAENTINKCLDSILAQTFSDIEIICVDDGSTDNSGKILDEYGELNTKIIVIHIENSGVTVARKKGIEKAGGKYIGFVDADDWIEEQMFSKLYEVMIKYESDMVCSGYCYEGDYFSRYYDGLEEGLYSKERMKYLRENAIYNISTHQVGIRGSIWCKLFNINIMKEIQSEIIDSLSFSEDKILVLLYLMKAKSVYILKEAYYHYIKNVQSKVNKVNYDYLAAVNDLYAQFRKMYLYDKFSENMKIQSDIYITELLYKGINSRMGFFESNLLWIDPYYLKQIPVGAKIVIYGAGDFGKVYYRQLARRKEVNIVGWVDPNYEQIVNDNFEICSPKILADIEYDYILLAYKGKNQADCVKENLLKLGVKESKILWFDQTEIYWKFAEVNGFLDKCKDDIDG